ncbi:putative polyphosphate/ATP-dependent NAD kinase [Chromatocurvus halotolerans]|uniref:Putative polyphosphate/ATP-dependent NAD kinase n=1 Tax=Chromatocurvus halotolerans TaxID=1132028 RepID=A0A4R2KW96_9GAMM|nr:putative polyphosphate/ATP-dependent NAD kinase [Chromatocurvus halotolerans]
MGLVVNPVAGMGGAVGLKGTDGALVEEARRRGAQPMAQKRAVTALEALQRAEQTIEVLTCAGSMGADAAGAAGLPHRVVFHPDDPPGAADTRNAVTTLLRENVELLLFAGGDGTAREVMASAAAHTPVLGIPAGVKMHSAVFGVTAMTAGDAARAFLDSGCPETALIPAEVMDREPGENGEPVGSPVLYGYLRVPAMPRLMQAAKAVGASDDAALGGALQRLADQVQRDGLCVLGPGATLLRLKNLLGATGTLLGVDVFDHGRCVACDVDERQLWSLVRDREARIVVGVIGGQGFLFGRGNQQISARVLARVGRQNIDVVSSAAKLASLPGGVLRVDTGDPAVNASLAGYLPVLTGSARQTLCRVIDADTEPA